jgi:hypothetical protein
MQAFGRSRGAARSACVALGLAVGAALAPLSAQSAPPLTIARQASQGPGAPAPPDNAIPAPGQDGRIAAGQIMRGELEPGDRLMADSTFADLWEFTGTAGVEVTIEVRSDEFDTYMQLLDAAGRKLGEDDDSAGDLNSRLVVRLPATGTYQIVVNSAGHERRAGLYTVSLR